MEYVISVTKHERFRDIFTIDPESIVTLALRLREVPPSFALPRVTPAIPTGPCGGCQGGRA